MTIDNIIALNNHLEHLYQFSWGKKCGHTFITQFQCKHCKKELIWKVWAINNRDEPPEYIPKEYRITYQIKCLNCHNDYYILTYTCEHESEKGLFKDIQKRFDEDIKDAILCQLINQKINCSNE